VTSPQYDRYACGPLEILVAAETETLRAKIADVLDLYNVEWPEPLSPRQIEIRESDSTAALGNGDYLLCARMNVDVIGGELVATCPSGPQAARDADGRRWTMLVPRGSTDPWVLTDIESLLSLVLTEGWRDEGWVPVHAATAILEERCAIICAESGGGKTSLTSALIRRGWRTLGDDKLLLRITENETAELCGLVHTFNLHPRTRSWFPEVGDLEQLPVYSDWTEKRKVRPETIWPGCTVNSAVPAVLFQITRSKSESPLAITPLDDESVLSILLHQTVVPTDASTARQILGTVARTARSLTGFRIDIGEDAYLDPDCLSLLETAVSSTLTSAAL
jgi:hypothetical protein